MEGNSIMNYMKMKAEKAGSAGNDLKLRLSDLGCRAVIKMVFFDNLIHGDMVGSPILRITHHSLYHPHYTLFPVSPILLCISHISHHSLYHPYYCITPIFHIMYSLSRPYYPNFTPHPRPFFPHFFTLFLPFFYPFSTFFLPFFQHPGNILVQFDGKTGQPRLVFLDAGIVYKSKVRYTRLRTLKWRHIQAH